MADGDDDDLNAIGKKSATNKFNDGPQRPTLEEITNSKAAEATRQWRG